MVKKLNEYSEKALATELTRRRNLKRKQKEAGVGEKWQKELEQFEKVAVQPGTLCFALARRDEMCYAKYSRDFGIYPIKPRKKLYLSPFRTCPVNGVGREVASLEELRTLDVWYCQYESSAPTYELLTQFEDLTLMIYPTFRAAADVYTTVLRESEGERLRDNREAEKRYATTRATLLRNRPPLCL